MTRALIEVAPAGGYLASVVVQDDVILRAENSNQTLHLGTGSNLALHVAASNVAIDGALTVGGMSVGGANAICDLADLLHTRRWMASNATFAGNAQIISSAMGTINPFTTVQYSSNVGVNNTATGQLITYTPTITTSTASNTGGTLSFATNGATTHTMEINPALLLPANATLQQVVVSTSNVAGGIKAAVVVAQPDLTNVKVVYTTPFWLGSAAGATGTLNTVPANYTVPNDGSNYYAAMIRTSNMGMYRGTTATSCNVVASATSIDAGSVYATTGGGAPWGYRANYIASGGPSLAGAPGLFFDQNWACRSALVRPASNVMVAALAGLGGTYGNGNIATLNSGFAIDASVDGGSNWTQVTLSNYGHFDQATMHVGGKAVLPAAGTAPSWRIRMPYINTSAAGIALRFS